MAAQAVAPRLKVLVSGASGMLGQALVASLSRRINPQVYRLVRRDPRSPQEIWWDPYEGKIDINAIEDFDAVVHLAGENIGSGDGLLAFTGRWTDRKKHHIMESRRRGTALLAASVAALRKPPKVFVSASGVGFYGSCGDTELTEAAPQGRGFLADVAGVWEASCEKAIAAGVRTVNLRFGAILDVSGGAIEKLYWPTYFCASGPIGSGRQYMSWITLTDAVRVIEHAIARSDLSGPVNACSPEPVTNAEFIGALAAAMSRPAVVPMPEAVVRAIFGEMGEETLLASQRATPSKLLRSGFRFLYPSVGPALRAALHLV